jgi:hypothetical protein
VEYVLWNSSQIVQFYISAFCPINKQSTESGYVSLQSFQNHNMTEVDKIEFHSLEELDGILLKLFDINNALTDSPRTANATPFPASDKKTEILKLLNRFVETICQDASKSDLLLHIFKDLLTLITGTSPSKSSTALSGEGVPLSQQLAEMAAEKERQAEEIKKQLQIEQMFVEKKRRHEEFMNKIKNFESMNAKEKTEFLLTLELSEIKESIPKYQNLEIQPRGENACIKFRGVDIPCSFKSIQNNPCDATLRLCLDDEDGKNIMFPVTNISFNDDTGSWANIYQYFEKGVSRVLEIQSVEGVLTKLTVNLHSADGSLKLTVKNTPKHNFNSSLENALQMMLSRR